MKLIRLFVHLGSAIRTLRRTHPAGFLCFCACFVFFIAVQMCHKFAGPPTQNWIYDNLAALRVEDPHRFSFAVLGDNKSSHAVFPRLLREVDQDPDIRFALDLGDLVFDGAMEKYRYFVRQVRGNIGKPFLTAIGNHELGDNGRGRYHDLFGPFYYSFRIGEISFIVLDDADGKGIDAWQRAWLEKELEQAQGYACRLVFMHVPLFDPRGGRHHHCLPETAARPLLELFEQYNVSHVFAAHIHGYYEGRWQGIPYTITGGAGGELVGKDPKHDFFHYVKVSVRGKAVDVTVQPIASPDYEWLHRIASIAWLYGYSFLRFHGLELALFLLMAYLLAAALGGERRGSVAKR